MEVYFRRDGKEHGPHSKEEIRSLLRSGELNKEDVVWYEGLESWKPIGEIVSLYAGLKSAPFLTGDEGLLDAEESVSGDVSIQGEKSRKRRVRNNPLSSSPSSHCENRRTGLFRKLLPWICGLALLYGAYPYYFVFSLKHAFENGDANRLEELIDFPSVRQSLKEQITAQLVMKMAKNEKGGAIGAGLAALLGPVFINGVVDSVVTPSGVAELVRKSKLPKPEKPSTSPSNGFNGELSRPGKLDIQYAFFSGPMRFFVVLNKTKIYMRLSGMEWIVYKLEPTDWDIVLK